MSVPRLSIVLLLSNLFGCGVSRPAEDRAFETARAALQEFDARHAAVHRGGRVPLHYLHWGLEASDALPVVLLHGSYDTAHEFVTIAPRLVAAGCRVVAVDWWGHGGTSIPAGPVAIEDFADDLCGLMDALGFGRAIVGGHSRGGMLSTAFYARYPNRTLGLILIDGGSTAPHRYFSSLGADGVDAWLDGWFHAETGLPMAPTFATERELFANFWSRIGEPREPAAMFAHLARATQRDDGRWSRWPMQALRWLEQDTRERTRRGMLRPAEGARFMASCSLLEPREVFAGLDLPVLILDADGRAPGDRDPTPRAENALLQAEHPEFVRHVVYDTGHYLHREQPERFLRDVAGFCRAQLEASNRGRR